MIMKYNMNKEQWKTIGIKSLQVGKKIIIKGVQAIVLESTATVLTTGFDEGLDGIKKLTFDDVVLDGKKKSKKKLLKKGDVQQGHHTEETKVNTDDKVVNISDDKVEILDKE